MDKKGQRNVSQDVESTDRVVSALLRSGFVTEDQVQAVIRLREEQSSDISLWRLLADQTEMNRDAVFAEAARIYAFPTTAVSQDELEDERITAFVGRLGPAQRDKLRDLRLLPIACVWDSRYQEERMTFASPDPMHGDVAKTLRDFGIRRYDLFFAPSEDVVPRLLEVLPPRNEFLERLETDGLSGARDLGNTVVEERHAIDEDELDAEINRSDLINLFEAAMVEGVRRGASDVHISPNRQGQTSFKMRVDGDLVTWHTEDKAHPEAVLAVVKDRSMGVDRFERDRAQDGNMQRQIDGALIRFRVSVLPVANVDPDIRSESVVIRILDDRKVHADLTKLGLPAIAMKRFDKAIRQPFGMVLITGPTGSGKSTTLAAALQRVITPKVNVISIEDPIEYMIPGVQQIKLSDRLDMSRAMRAVLRHDPDIVMVGEIRDFETADLAIKLANTGHLTFSTLHTNDAPSAVSRLYKLGVEPFLLAYAINLIMAQRLVRVLCADCREVDEAPDESVLGEIGLSLDEIPGHVYRRGSRKRCPSCRGTGYAGRRAIAEALYLSPAIRQLVFNAGESIDEAAIKEVAIREGMDTLQDAAASYVKQGLIATDEVVRVVATL